MSEQKNLSPSEILTHTTTRIVGILSETKSSIGTGFFFNFKKNENSYPVIITNKHVIDDCHTLQFRLNEVDEKNNRINENHIQINLTKDEINKLVILHPEKNVDLCAILFGPIFNKLETQNKKPYFRWTDKTLIPSVDEWQSFSALEDITMIGYPNGIWDKKNNLPIARKGITATHPRIDYEQRSEFLVDVAVFPGSSGSPVYLFNQGSYATDKGITMGSRLKLLGINYAVYQHTAEGDISIKKTPTAVIPFTEIKIPNNLGVIIKSTKILDFEPLIVK